jgi:long-chain-fatty-acid---luciferin-component ligase
MIVDARIAVADRDLRFEDLTAISPLDDLIFQTDNVFYRDPDAVNAFQVDAIGQAFDRHYESNARYRDYCRSFGFEPGMIRGLEDLALIPLITSTQFKISDVLSCERSRIVKECTSSGTAGSISRVYRDERTLGRFLGSIRCNMEQMYALHDAFCLHLGPSRDEAQGLWISYAMGLADLVFPTENFVIDAVFQPEALLRRIREVRGRYEHLILTGAPIMFLRLDEYMEAERIRLHGCENFFIITAGGWKRYSGQAIPRAEFEDRLARRFDGLSQGNFRDCFNMVELNSVLVECEHQVKHVPPWLRMLTLDPRTLREVPAGEVGLLAFLDSTTTSYPGFILTDDFARLGSEGACPCGRSGRGLEIVRRVARVESRGCALKLDHSYMAGDRPSGCLDPTEQV